MIDKRSLLPELVKKVRALPIGDYLEVRSYKRDRGLLLIRLDARKIRIEEDGFERNRFEAEEADLKRLLKPLIKREFPRSNKLRVYARGPYDPFRAARVARKTI